MKQAESSLGRVVNLGVKFLSEIVRKAANIIGILCAVITGVATATRYYGIPGSSLLFILVAIFMIVVALPLNVRSSFRINRDSVRRTADVLGLISISLILGSFMLRGGPAWLVRISGETVFIIFLVTFILASRRSGVVTKWISPLAISVGIIVGLFVFSATHRHAITQEMLTQNIDYFNAEEAARAKEDSLSKIAIEQYMDSSWSSLDSAALIYYNSARELVALIEDVKKGIATASNGSPVKDAVTPAILIRADDYDISNFYMIGPDIENPTGKGVEIHAAIVKFCNQSDSPINTAMRFGMALNDDRSLEMWLKENFYRRPLIDVLTQLTSFQRSILNTLNEALDWKRFGKI